MREDNNKTKRYELDENKRSNAEEKPHRKGGVVWVWEEKKNERKAKAKTKIWSTNAENVSSLTWFPPPPSKPLEKAAKT